MLDAIKPLLDSDLVNEETRSAIAEQWEAKLNETRQQVTAELREEFAKRYEHDKSTLLKSVKQFQRIVQSLLLKCKKHQAHLISF